MNQMISAPGAAKRMSRYVAASDGLRLHYFEYPAPAGSAPVVCLPGLARSAADFDPLAQALAANGRRVLALDYRGRGESDWDPDWTHYNPDVEEEDILAVLAHAGAESAVFIGTSRGGLHTMRLAKKRPELLRGAVLNDIGPVVEVAGLLRIKRYVGKLPPLANMSAAVALLRFTAGALFTNVSMREWEIYARQTFMEKDGQVVLRYDPALLHTLDTVEPNMEPPNFWPEFEALASVPVMAIRGANSDILSPEVLSEMARRHPNFRSLTLEGQGHAPLLLDWPTIDAIVEFIANCL
jgi:pimeloyl-ACP methyl ester carboxylesterase